MTVMSILVLWGVAMLWCIWAALSDIAASLRRMERREKEGDE